MSTPHTVFGPVPSRRLGRSLGVDIIPRKLCTLDCIYCELGRTDKRALRRREYVAARRVLSEIEAAIRPGGIDYITFSGSGEPTLNSALGTMIHEVKSLTTIPVAVITNGTLLFIEDVRNDLLEADVVLPSLDAATNESFELINRPHPRLRLRTILEGLIQFRREYRGAIWLEVFLVQGVNDSIEDLVALRAAFHEIRPDRIQLNTVARPPAEESAQPLDPAKLEEIRKFFGEPCEIIAASPPGISQTANLPDSDFVTAIIDRRPMTVGDLAATTGVSPHVMQAWLDTLEAQHRVQSFLYRGERFFRSGASDADNRHADLGVCHGKMF